MSDRDRGDSGRAGRLGICIAMGLALGAVVGVSLDNLALGIGPGIALGIAAGLELSSRAARKAKEDDHRGAE
jgi:hypothetical protein